MTLPTTQSTMAFKDPLLKTFLGNLVEILPFAL